MEQITKKILIILKILAIVLFIIIFFALCLVAMSNTVKNMKGESLQVVNHSGGIVLNLYGNAYLIDFTPLRQIEEWLQAHWIFVPRLIRIIQYMIELL